MVISILLLVRGPMSVPDGRSGYLKARREFGRSAGTFVPSVGSKLRLIIVFPGSDEILMVVYSMLGGTRTQDRQQSPRPGGKITDTDVEGRRKWEERQRAKSFTGSDPRWRVGRLTDG